MIILHSLLIALLAKGLLDTKIPYVCLCEMKKTEENVNHFEKNTKHNHALSNGGETTKEIISYLQTT